MRERGRTWNRRAAERRAVIAGLQRARRFAVDQKRADGQAVRQGFRQRDGVGAHAEVLEREELTDASHSGLDFVEDEQRAALRGDAPRGLQELARRRKDAALALHRLDDEGGRLAVDGSL